MPMIDGYTRAGLALEVDRSKGEEDVIDVRSYLFEVHGEPDFIPSRTGPGDPSVGPRS